MNSQRSAAAPPRTVTLAKRKELVEDLKLFFLVEVVVNNGQQKISIERSLDDFLALDQQIHRVINIQSYPASVVGKLPDLIGISQSISAAHWNDLLERYLLSLIKHEECFIPKLFQFLGLAFGMLSKKNDETIP